MKPPTPRAGERLADQPQGRRPKPDEEGASLGIPALVLVDGLRPDPEDDAETDRSERGGVELPGTGPTALRPRVII
jgi:hypothetical protein